MTSRQKIVSIGTGSRLQEQVLFCQYFKLYGENAGRDWKGQVLAFCQDLQLSAASSAFFPTREEQMLANRDESKERPSAISIAFCQHLKG